MANENYAQIIETTKKQEALLRFDHFSNRDAWELGAFLAGRVHDRKIEMAISIRKLSGSIVFQYLTDNTTLSNQQWMQRKFNTVCLTEGCSLRAWASSIVKNQDLAAQGLDSKDYALCGGGFPIKLKTGEMVAVLIVSNLPHMVDRKSVV